MLSWRLWQMIQTPFYIHPVYTRFLNQTHSAFRLADFIPLPRLLRSRAPWGCLAMIAFALFILTAGQLLLVPFLLLIPLVPFTGSIYGLSLTVQIAGFIARERAQGRYNLLAVTPLGVLGLNWSITSAVYHRNRAIGQLRDTVRGLYMVMFVVVGLFLFVALLNQFVLGDLPPTPTGMITALNDTLFTRNSILLGIAISALFVDFIQSIIIGSIMGMLTSLYTHSEINARGLALGIYLMTQLLFYATVGVICLIILPELLALVGIDNVVFISLVQFIVFVVSREGLIMLMWQRLAEETDTDLDELNAMMKDEA